MADRAQEISTLAISLADFSGRFLCPISLGDFSGRRAATRRDSHDPAEIQYICVTTGFLEGAFLHRRGITNNARQRTAETICPRETEEVLYAHDNVADVAVVGLADALFG